MKVWQEKEKEREFALAEKVRTGAEESNRCEVIGSKSGARHTHRRLGKLRPKMPLLCGTGERKVKEKRLWEGI